MGSGYCLSTRVGAREGGRFRTLGFRRKLSHVRELFLIRERAMGQGCYRKELDLNLWPSMVRLLQNFESFRKICFTSRSAALVGAALDFEAGLWAESAVFTVEATCPTENLPSEKRRP